MDTIKELYGKDYPAQIGAKGGKAPGKPKGMAWLKIHDPERLKEISSKGGKKESNNESIR